MGAILGDAGKGAAVGAAAGGIRGRRQKVNAHQDQKAAQKQLDNQAAATVAAHNAKVAEQRATYDRARKVCLEGRDYSVN